MPPHPPAPAPGAPEDSSPSARGDRVRDLFLRACDLPAEERRAFLERQCEDELREEVEALLGFDHEQGDTFETPALGGGLDVSALGDEEADPAPLPERFGPYRVESLLGRGGMGEVYRAEQEQPKRKVALKVIQQGLADGRSLQRFQLEAEILGRLQHPGIAQIFEAGVADGEGGPRPYFALELIDGRELLDYADQEGLSAAQRLELLAQVGDAVHYAHQRGVIHRDLKPANILVDRTGQPKILDFGIARTTSADTRVTTVSGSVRRLLGTLPYMSPEQVAGDPDAVDTRCDVYALGVLAYQLLAGALPLELKDRSLAEAARVVSEEEPRPLRSHDRAFRGDLETIVAKAMAKEKERRYASASELAADLRRFLRDEPIQARPATTLYQLRKFSRRNRPLVAALAGAFLILVAGVITAGLGWQRAVDNGVLAQGEADRADREAEAASERAEQLQQVADFQEQQLARIDAEALGWRIRELVFEKARSAGARRKLDGAGLDAEALELERILAGADFTGLGTTALDEHLFAPTLEALASFDDQPLVQAQLLQATATALRELGRHDLAEEPLRRCLELRRRELGDRHGDTLDALSRVGTNLSRRGRYAEAQPLLEEAWERSSAELGPTTEIAMTALSNLAQLHKFLSEYDRAEELMLRADALALEAGGEGSEAWAAVNTNLASLYLAQGKLADARRAQERVLASIEQTFGAGHEETLTSLNNLSQIAHDEGEFSEAEEFARRAIEGRRRALGDDHPSTLISLGNLGRAVQAQGRLEEARAIYEEVLALNKRVNGPLSPGTLVTSNNLAGLLQQLGDLPAAERYFRETIDGCRLALGDQHVNTLMTIGSLGVLLRRQGRLEEAAPLYEESLAGFRARLRPGHPAILTATHNLAALRSAQGELEEAEALYREALAGRRAGGGDDHPETLKSMKGLAMVLRERGKMAEAEPLFLEAVAGSRRRLGDDHADTMRAITSLAVFRAKQERFEEAEALHREALAGLRAALGERHADTLREMSSLAHVLEELDRLAEAEPLRREGVRLNLEVYGEDLGTVYAMDALARNLHRQDQLAEASTWMRRAAAGFDAQLGEGERDTLNAWRNLGILLEDQEEYAEAIEVAELLRLRSAGDEQAVADIDAWVAATRAKMEQG